MGNLWETHWKMRLTTFDLWDLEVFTSKFQRNQFLAIFTGKIWENERLHLMRFSTSGFGGFSLNFQKCPLLRSWG